MAEIQFFDGNDYRIAYLWSHRPACNPLVVIHVLGDSSIHTYAPRFARTALKNTPALFIDLPGFGESTAEPRFAGTIEALAEAASTLLSSLQIMGAPIFAHSMGANVAITIATHHPRWKTPMILAEPLLNPEDSVLASTIVRFGEDQFAERGFAMLQRATALQAKRGEVAAEAFLPVLAMAEPHATHRAAASLLADRDPSFITTLLGTRPCPHLLVGERTTSAAIAELPASLQLIRVPQAGHNMIVEAETETACIILDIVDGIDQD